ncbi:MAG TPA: outer membrane beta-barrel protein [Fimbriimonadaceae bacterium]|nr:outer membrane beta-barrel protein [Fimbriimonadaceae bacterium]
MNKAVISVATIASCLGLAGAQDFAKKWNLDISGYLDGYYQYDFGRPASGDSVNGRGFDIAHQRPNIAFVELDISRPTSAKEPVGFTLDLYGGRGPEIIHLAEPGGRNKYRYVRQGYVTYAAPGKGGVTVDFGKFDTWIGYEGIDNRSQEEYGRSFNWAYSEPTYETGLRVSGKPTDKLTVSLFLVQGWNEVEDGNGGKSVGAALSYAPDGDTSFTLQNHYGKEGSTTANDAGSYGGIGFPNPGTATVHLIDFIAARQLTKKTKLAFNVDYASSVGTTNGGNWNGEVLYLHHQLSDNRWLGVRLERMEDSDGLRAGVPVTFNSLTGTYDWIASKNATIRFELRHDIASRTFFDSDSGAKKERTTATVAAIVKF